MHIHYFQHAPFEGLGSIEEWARSQGHTLSATEFHGRGTLPDIDEFDLLVVMGGPMSAYDDDKYSWLVEEKRFINESIRRNKKVLGVCLGSQLLAAALGARVFRNRHAEIGWFPVNLTREAAASPLFATLPPRLTVFQWHGDTFDLPAGAIRIAKGDVCLNQAFQYGPNVVGLQFHLEFTLTYVSDLILNCAEDLGRGPYVQSADELLADKGRFKAANEILSGILDRLCAGPGHQRERSRHR